MGFVSCWVYLNYFKEGESCRAQDVKNDQDGCFPSGMQQIKLHPDQQLGV